MNAETNQLECPLCHKVLLEGGDSSKISHLMCDDCLQVYRKRIDDIVKDLEIDDAVDVIREALRKHRKIQRENRKTSDPDNE